MLDLPHGQFKQNKKLIRSFWRLFATFLTVDKTVLKTISLRERLTKFYISNVYLLNLNLFEMVGVVLGAGKLG